MNERQKVVDRVESDVFTLARAVLYAFLIFAALVLVGLAVLFASCALSSGRGGWQSLGVLLASCALSPGFGH